MINFSNSIISNCVLHFVGNQYSGELPIYTNKQLKPKEGESDKFKKIFTKVFSNPIQASQFTHSLDVNQNSIFKICEGLFDSSLNFIKGSRDIVKYLYEQSKHYSIKSGQVFIVQFEDVSLENVISNAIGIFKIESDTEFLKCQLHDSQAYYEFNKGVLSKNIEKCCIVFNHNYDEGFNVYSYEKNNTDSQYWNSLFLSIEKKSDDYNTTTVLLESIKDFLFNTASIDSKKTRIETYSNSIELIKESNENLNVEKYLNQVLPNKNTRDEYNEYLGEYQNAKGIELPSNIIVSKSAINYQMKKSKSVIKLDKNFHIYIHGDESKIETGIDETGRKYYKLFFDYES